MKLFFGEFKPDYEKYHFPYQVWLLREEGDEVAKIYDHGFLPIRSLPNVFYLCRSLRVNLDKFEPSSENRRILKKTVLVEAKLLPLSEFDYTPAIQKFCVDYVRQRLEKSSFSAATVRSIFKEEVYNSVLVFTDQEAGKEVGYAVCYQGKEFLQYAHAFYDLDYLAKNLGARMMLESIVWAKDRKKKYVYLGTAYGKGALYKTQFKGGEFFNGLGWSENLSELKVLVRGEIEQQEYLLKNKKYIQDFHSSLHEALINKGVRVNF